MSFTQEPAALTSHATGDWLTPTPAFPGHWGRAAPDQAAHVKKAVGEDRYVSTGP